MCAVTFQSMVRGSSPGRYFADFVEVQPRPRSFERVPAREQTRYRVARQKAEPPRLCRSAPRVLPAKYKPPAVFGSVIPVLTLAIPK